MSRSRRRSALLTVAVAGAVASLLTGMLTGCSSVSCAQWVAFESDEQRTESADLVAVVADIRADGDMPIMGSLARAYLARVVEVTKGDAVIGDDIRIGSTADNCASDPYGEGDQMLLGDPLRVYLTAGEQGYTTLTPFDGVQPLD